VAQRHKVTKAQRERKIDFFMIFCFYLLIIGSKFFTKLPAYALKSVRSFY
jgi:hypothetical protein